LRWQDDVGPVVDSTKPTLPMAMDNAIQPTDVPKKIDEGLAKVADSILRHRYGHIP
jgi:hypothetical protein